MNDIIRNSDLFKRHVARIRSSLAAHSPGTICDFITTHTKLRGAPFSFAGHDYQRKILEDKSQNIVIIKSAQIGISEMSARLALAKAVLINGFSTIYTLPSASAAQTFMKERIDPIIESSPYLSEMLSKEVDNSSVKRFGDSYLHLKGCQVDRQAISTPADMLISDEVDNSSPEVVTLFESRLGHSPYALTVKLSTPTVPGYGIDLLYKQSRRHMNMCKCNHCNHWFYPDYYEHVRIPDFGGQLEQITAANFANPSFRWQEAYVACPSCGLPADLAPEHREWVIENPHEPFPAAGYRISPFDCPSLVTPAKLIKASTDYARKQDFSNQKLGVPLEDKESSLARDELEKAIISTYPGGGFSYVMGVDMGSTCWITVAAVMPGDMLIIVHTEGVPLFKLRERRRELAVKYRVRMTVVDANPYTESVYQMQQEDTNLFGAIYVRSKSIDLFKVKDVKEDAEKGTNELRQVNIARDRVFDLIMLMIRSGTILKVSDENNETWKTHLLDQKRVKEFDGEELVTVWRKTQGTDHLHHSLLYTLVASRMLGVSSYAMSGMSFVLGKFKHKS